MNVSEKFLGFLEANPQASASVFEAGDKVVYVDDFMPDSVSVVSEVNDRVWLNGNNAVCIEEMIKHAEDEEIAAGKRLDGL